MLNFFEIDNCCYNPCDPDDNPFKYHNCDCSGSGHAKCQHKKKDTCSVFTITTPPKEGHPWQHHNTESDHCFAVTYPNGKQKTVKGGTINLARGRRYAFKFVQTNKTKPFEHLLFFTQDPTGGKQGGKTAGDVDPTNYNPTAFPGTPAPYGAGTKSFTVTDDFPKIMYYQDKNNQFLGGIILVHDREDNGCGKHKDHCRGCNRHKDSCCCTDEQCSQCHFKRNDCRCRFKNSCGDKCVECMHHGGGRFGHGHDDFDH
jgi:hypothetical protein